MKLIVRIWRKIYWFVYKKMSPLEVSYLDKRNVISDIAKLLEYSIFVETGTFLGDTIFYFKDNFKQLFSIELSKELANRAKKRFEVNTNIFIIEGNSSVILETLIMKICEPALFWLDGHYSSEFFLGDEFIITAKGELNTPIIKELDIILNSNFNHAILIDDARLFIGHADYPTIQFIKNKIHKIKPNYNFYIEKDIIHIIPK